MKIACTCLVSGNQRIHYLHTLYASYYCLNYTASCKLNRLLNSHTIKQAYNEVSGMILICYRQNSLYPSSLQRVIKSLGMKIISL